MPRTYEGVLKDDRIDWSRDAPPRHRPFSVRVTILDEGPADEDRGRRMADALRRLAENDAFRKIGDPAAWQRQTRADRPLPGRDG